jgi:hypothetical protein
MISETTEALSAPSGLGTYCSKTSSNGAWSLGILTTGNSCAGGASTIQRHGFYSISGWNFAYIRCSDNSWWVAHGAGDAPLNNVKNAASGRPGCIITAAPREMPIFSSPLANPSSLSHTNGFDYARLGGTINTVALGTGVSSAANEVDRRGRIHTESSGQDHQGHDWPVE